MSIDIETGIKTFDIASAIKTKKTGGDQIFLGFGGPWVSAVSALVVNASRQLGTISVFIYLQYF